jgi:hypothetical protein
VTSYDVSGEVLVLSLVRVVVGALDLDRDVEADQELLPSESWVLSMVEPAKLGDPIGPDQTQVVEKKEEMLPRLWIPSWVASVKVDG